MKTLLSFIRKEFYHVLRDQKTLLILFGMPIMQVLIFGFALSNEVKDSNVLIVDQAKDQASQQIIQKIQASHYFKIQAVTSDVRLVDQSFKQGKIKIAVVIPEGFYENLLHTNKAQIQLINDASDPNSATTINQYMSNILMDYQQDLNKQFQVPLRITPEIRMLYNPQLLSAPNFVPGVMALVLMLVCVMMTSVAIVREKELGTMEVLLVSPFQPFFIIIAKAIPYLFLSFINVCSILILSVYVLDLPIKGNLILLLSESILFIITCLSIGIFISVKTASQQVAMLISLMGMMLPTVLFSGFMFPIENMPKALQYFSNIVPSKWYYNIVKSIMIKGVGIEVIWKETLILSGMTLFFLALSIKNFKIRLE